MDVQSLCAIVAILALFGLLVSCRESSLGPRSEQLQLMLGKTVREVVTSLAISETSLRAGDEPPGRYCFVTGDFNDGSGAKLTVSVNRGDWIDSQNRKVVATEMLDKTVAVIAVSFPMDDKRPDLSVGSASSEFYDSRQ